MVIYLLLSLITRVQGLSVSLPASATKHFHMASYQLPLMHSGGYRRLPIDGLLIRRESLATTVRRVQLDMVQRLAVVYTTMDYMAMSCVGILACTLY